MLNGLVCRSTTELHVFQHGGDRTHVQRMKEVTVLSPLERLKVKQGIAQILKTTRGKRHRRFGFFKREVSAIAPLEIIIKRLSEGLEGKIQTE